MEAATRIGGYWVHAAKVRRMGVPILLRHSIKRAIGEDVVTGAEIVELDEKFNETDASEYVDCDTVCLAVGLAPTNELLWQAGCRMRYVPSLCGHVPERDKNMRTSNENVWVAGDSSGIEEASAAMIEGRIAGLCAAASLDCKVPPGNFDRYWGRLSSLRAGEVGEKIRAGVSSVTASEWGDVQ
jgi:sarcosine oxidase subunit alpha